MKKTNETKLKNTQPNNKTFVKAVNHTRMGPWHQYDILLDSRIYGWEFMKDWADYVIGADLDNISEVMTGGLGSEDINITKAFLENNQKCTQTPELKTEQGTLSVAGTSQKLGSPLKIVWINQTSTLRLFTFIEEQSLITEYIDTMAYRTFGEESKITTEPKNEKNTTTHARTTKYAVIAYCLLATIIASAVAFFASMFLFMFLEAAQMIAIVTPIVTVFWVCLCVYMAKFRWISKSYRSLKKNNNEHYIDDIDLANTNANIVCGQLAIFSKTPYAIIPYSDIAWVHPPKNDPNCIVIHTYNNTQYQLKIKNLYSYIELIKIIKEHNPDVIDKANAKVVHQEHPELFEKKHKTKFVIACFLMLFGVSLFIIALVNHTLATGNIIISALSVISSIILFLYSKFGNSLKEGLENITARLQESTIINKAAKVVYAVTIASFVGFLFSGLADFEKGVKICYPIAIASVIPFFITIFLNLGIFEKPKPVKVSGNKVHVNSAGFKRWKKEHVNLNVYAETFVIPLKNKTPEIWLYDDGKKIYSYTLQTKDDEDFSGKFFIATIQLGYYRKDGTPAVQISGFISDKREKREITINDIGYRTEIYYIRSGGKTATELNNDLIGQDLVPKALKFQGYTTPGNIRLVGICPHCQKSFTFHGYAFYMIQSDVAYSDDGLDCLEVTSQDIDKESWSYTTDSKTFRYYNSFCCPHCKKPYIDYKKYPENKVFGSSGCVHLGKKAYKEE